jgi:hypothetical protein
MPMTDPLPRLNKTSAEAADACRVLIDALAKWYEHARREDPVTDAVEQRAKLAPLAEEDVYFAAIRVADEALTQETWITGLLETAAVQNPGWPKDVRRYGDIRKVSLLVAQVHLEPTKTTQLYTELRAASSIMHELGRLEKLIQKRVAKQALRKPWAPEANGTE